MIKKLIAGCIALLCLASGATANTAGPAWDKFPTEKMADQAALQNGAKLFVNYCLNCHSASYMRYNRLTDLGLTEAQIKQNLLFATDKVGDTMKTSLDPKLAKESFGTLRARVRVRKARVPTTSTRTCVVSTATKPRPPAGTTRSSPAWRCRMCCGSCRASSRSTSTANSNSPPRAA
jgi:cytochrome c1